MGCLLTAVSIVFVQHVEGCRTGRAPHSIDRGLLPPCTSELSTCCRLQLLTGTSNATWDLGLAPAYSEGAGVDRERVQKGCIL